MWTSEDAGATFVNVSVPYYLHDMKMHPSVPSRILATGLTDCCQKSLACTTCKAVLLLSVDKGASWRNLTDYLYYRGDLAYSWAPVLNETVDKSLAYVDYTNKEGDQRVLLGEPMNLNLLRDYDNASTLIQVPHGGPFVWEDVTYMMARVATGRPGLSSIVVSRDAGATFSVFAFPPVSSFNSLRVWLPTESGNPFLGVFDGPEYEDGTVFVSTGSSTAFTISLRRIIQRFNQPHWTHIGSAIPGTYIANHYPNTDGLSATSVISYNHGGNWHAMRLASIPGPAVDNDDEDDPDDDDDDQYRVHLAAPFPGSKFFTSPSTPGLIVAAGQIGPLLTDWGGQTVLISRDAGRSWNAALNGSFIVFGINGGTVILAAEDSGYTTTLHYSIDYGTSWSSCDFSSVPVKPISMRSNFEEEEAPFVIFDTVDATGKYLIFTLNMTNVYNRTCTFSDFENWPLRDAKGNGCVFGRSIVFSHRASLARCRKLSGQARVIASSPCSCGKEDFICSYCYARSSSTGRCDFLWDDCDNSRPAAPDNCTETWKDPTNPAYVLSPDTHCLGGMTIDDLESIISCPPAPVVDNPPPPYATLKKDVLVTISAISIALCGIVIVGIYYCARNGIQGAEHLDVEGWKSLNSSKSQPTSSTTQHHHQHHHGLQMDSLNSSNNSTPQPDDAGKGKGSDQPEYTTLDV